MSGNLTIDVAELRAAMARLVDQIAVELDSSIDLSADYYWSVGHHQKYDLSAEPTPTVGQLSDDVASIRSMLAADDDPVVWHDLGHLVGILQRVATLCLPPTSG